MHNSPKGVSVAQNIPWGPVLLKGLGWELLFILLCLGRAAGAGGMWRDRSMFRSYLCSSLSGSTAATHARGYLVTEALQGFCQAVQAFGAKLMDSLVQAPIHY